VQAVLQARTEVLLVTVVLVVVQEVLLELKLLRDVQEQAVLVETRQQ
jgi:hypothetical protein